MLAAEITAAAALAAALYTAAMIMGWWPLMVATLAVCAGAPAVIARRHDRRAGRR